jgi:hypothetical protein
MASYRAAPMAALQSRIDVLKAAQAADAAHTPASLLAFPLPGEAGIGARLLQQFEARMASELRAQELAYLEQLQALLVVGADRNAASARLEALRLAHALAFDSHAAIVRQYSQLGWLDRQLTSVPQLGSARLAMLDAARQRAARENNAAYAAFERQRIALERLGAVQQAHSFVANRDRLRQAAAPLTARLARAQDGAARNLLARLWALVREVLPAAALVLALGLLAHLAVKALFYFVLAPLAAKLAPVRLAPDQELLILPEFIQSAPANGAGRTRWLLDWSHPWTSLIAGMVALTSITSKDGAPVVVSASDDASSEIALIALAAGSAMVLQPRCLIGVVGVRGTPLTIRSHWRLGSLHAWLTLQLRYLVFHGPVTLIVSGTRGVRVEAAQQGRLISQSATLGFSASLAYSTERCETFFPYYQGKTALLLDRFEGAGVYVVDETPRAGRQAGFIGRGLEGMADAALKVFGI